MNDEPATHREMNLAYMSMRNASITDRVVAAAAAGFDGIGLRPEAVPGLRLEGWVNERIRDLLLAHDMRVSEIEPLRIFRDDLLELCLDLAPYFAAPRIQVAPPFEPTLDLAEAARWLRDAAQRLAPATLCIEFLPPTGVPDARTAAELLDRIGVPNVGICVDAWHVFRGAGLHSIDALDAEHVAMVQVGDGTMAPLLDDYIEDCLCDRRPLGEGEFDLYGFMERLPATAPVSVEVISIELDRSDPTDVARRLAATTRPFVSSR